MKTIKSNFTRLVGLSIITISMSVCAIAQTEGSGDIFAQQNTWQSKTDLISSGAAASVVMHLSCRGQNEGEQAHNRAYERMINSADRIANSYNAETQVVRDYVTDGYNMKVRAMWQANQGKSCQSLSRLTNIANASGFDIVR